MGNIQSHSTSPQVLIPFESHGFPANTVPNGSRELCVTWDDVGWAAVTVGRPGLYYVFAHGKPSIYEAIFRWSLAKMTIERRIGYPPRFRRTAAARNLDPTEKGMANYFLGMTLCKLFADEFLATPWLLHLDVFRPYIDVELGGGSRPDLIGHNILTNEWHGFECKGRVSHPGPAERTKAKEQAQRLRSVDGVACSLHIAAITYFRNEVVNFYWCDPPSPENGGDPIHVSLPEDAWQHYYGLVAEVVARPERGESIGGAIESERWRDGDENLHASVEQSDVEVVVHRSIEKYLAAGQWEQARFAAREAARQIAGEGFHADGIQVHAGGAWNENPRAALVGDGGSWDG